jgi:hypothetical protein
MTQQHPIVPPPELVEKWGHLPANWNTVAPLIAQWGADQELEACCEYLVRRAQWEPEDVDELRATRRPSLKEQALDALKSLQRLTTDPSIIEPLRRALEALPE